MIPSINNLADTHDTTFTPTYGVILFTLGMRLSIVEENPGNVNVFIDTDIYSSKHEIQDGMKTFGM